MTILGQPPAVDSSLCARSHREITQVIHKILNLKIRPVFLLQNLLLDLAHRSGRATANHVAHKILYSKT